MKLEINWTQVRGPWCMFIFVFTLYECHITFHCFKTRNDPSSGISYPANSLHSLSLPCLLCPTRANASPLLIPKLMFLNNFTPFRFWDTLWTRSMSPKLSSSSISPEGIIISKWNYSAMKLNQSGWIPNRVILDNVPFFSPFNLMYEEIQE